MPSYVFTRNGGAANIRPNWTITEAANGRNRMDFAVHSLDGSVRYANDDEVILTEDGTRIFGGLVDRPAERGFGGSGAASAIEQALGAVDFNVYPSRIAVSADTDQPSESLQARLTWIAGLMAAQGVTLDAGQAVGPTLPAASYTAGQFLIDVLAETVALADGTGATSWVWNIDYSKVLSAVEAGTAAAPFNLADGDGQVVGDIEVEQPRSTDYANYIRLLGGAGTRDVTDAWTGDGSTVTFALTYTLASGYGYVTCAGVYETLGTGATWEYDSATNSITRTSAPGVGAAISMTYVAQFPKAVTADGGVAAANRVQKVYTAPEVFDVVVMQALADSYLTRDMASPKTVRYTAAWDKTDLHPGDTQTITSAKRNLSGTHLITEVRIVKQDRQLVHREVTAVSSTRLPSTLREKFQQTFGGGSTGAASASSITVVTGGTYLSSPASLGGSDTQLIACDSPARVRNPQPYDAPATLAVTVQGLVAARSAVNVTVILWDETDGAAEFSDSPVAASATPVPFSFSGTVTIGHRYWLYVQSGTAGVTATACGQVVGA